MWPVQASNYTKILLHYSTISMLAYYNIMEPIIKQSFYLPFQGILKNCKATLSKHIFSLYNKFDQIQGYVWKIGVGEQYLIS